MKKIIIRIFCAFFAGNSMVAAEFQNLGFEEARIDNLQPDPLIVDGWTGSVSDLLPGWQLSLGGQPLENMNFNTQEFVVGPLAILYDRNHYHRPMEGDFGLFFYRAGSDMHYSLTQTGEIPIDRPWLTYIFRGDPLMVTVNGVDVGPSTIASEGPSLVIADLSDFAGQTIELGIRTHDPFMPFRGNLHHLDGIAFVVPEPSTVSLLLIGSAALAGGWLVRRSRWKD